MKVRNGFVSNSSSSSFILVGKKYRFDDVTSTLHALKVLGYTADEAGKFREQMEMDFDEFIYSEEFGDLIRNSPSPLSMEFSQEGGYCYIGKSLSTLSEIENFTAVDKIELSKMLNVDITSIDLHYGEINY